MTKSSQATVAEKHRHTLGLVTLLILLLICDFLFSKSFGWARLAGGIAAYAGLFAIYRLSGLRLTEIGLARSKIAHGVRVSLILVAVLFGLAVAAYLITGDSFKDPRYHLSIGNALYVAFITVPLGTVIFEELTFRGIVPAMLEKLRSHRLAVFGSSILFGLWHLPTAMGINGTLKNNNLLLAEQASLLFVFLFTTAMGFLLIYLRYKSDSLIVPIACHWFVNAAAVILAAISWA
jgi:membrane protease YdiL (CAAX protease family)